MSGLHDYSIKINSFAQCQRLQQVANECISVQVVDMNGSTANAKSLLSLMSLDFTHKVRIIASTADEIYAIINALQLK